MEIIFYLVPISLLLGLAGVAAYLWAVRNGQYDDLDTPAVRILIDETENKKNI